MAIEDMEIQASAKFGFRELIMQQLAKVTNFNNNEFRGGFYTIITTKTGEEKETYVQDSREVFCNGCFALALLLQPTFSEEMKISFKKIREDLETINKEFLERSSVNEEVILGESFYENQKDKILLDTYKNKKLILFLKLFARLSEELKRKNYFEIIGTEY